MKSLLIKGGLVVDPSDGVEQLLDIFVSEGRIAEVATDIEPPRENCDVIDARGLHVVPGLVDAHVHFRDPGFPKKETIFSGARAAVAGGFTSVICMANTKPVIDSAEIFGYVRERMQRASCNVYSVASLTRGMEGRELVSMKELSGAGVVGFSDDGKSVESARIMLEGLKEAAALGLPVCAHCEDPSLFYDHTINRGPVAQQLGLEGEPALAQEIVLARDIWLAEAAEAWLHVQHISTAREVELVRQAKGRGVRVTAEATPHHFALTEEEVFRSGTNAKMSPPLRTMSDVEAIRRGLADGTLDIIATDHAPHTVEEKSRNLKDAPNGIVGLETSLGLGLTVLVEGGWLSFSDLIFRMSSLPARLFGLPCGTLRKGSTADITVIDRQAEWIVDPLRFHSNSRNTPFARRRLKGRAVYTIIEGRCVYRDE